MTRPARTRAGRPRREDVARDNQGRVMASEYREDPRTLPQWNRLRDIAAEMMIDPRLGTQRGRMFYQRQITASEFEAANRWADMLDAFDILVLGRRRTPASPALERLGHGESSGRDPEAVARFRERHSAAHAALLAGGKICEIATNRLCREEGLGAFYTDAQRGLRLLAAHWGITKASKRRLG